MPKKTNRRHPIIGRPPKPNKDAYVQITCVLRRDTVKKLKAAAGGTRWGYFLQEHLDRYPLPTRKEHLAELFFENAVENGVIEAATRKPDDAPRKTAKS